MSKFVSYDYFRGTERSRLFDIVSEPHKQCPRYRMPIPEGAIPECRIGPVFRHDLVKWFHNLIALSDIKKQHRLRNALRTLHNYKVLKACMLQRILFAVKSGIMADEQLQAALEYEAVRLGAERCVQKAQVELKALTTSIIEKDFLRPKVPTLQTFTDAKAALAHLALNMMDALTEIHEYEAMLTSPDVIKLIAGVNRRQLAGELLSDFCNSQGEKRWWEEFAILLDAGRAVYLEPESQKAEANVRDSTNESLRQDVKKLSDEDVKKVKRWYDAIEPGLYDRIQEDSDQTQILIDVQKSEPRLSELCSTMVMCSLAFSGSNSSTGGIDQSSGNVRVAKK